MQSIKLPKFLLRSIQGAIGKRYVIKHYGKKVVITKYPVMSNIIPTKNQQKQRNLFKDAVVYAKEVIADPARKAAWQKRLKRINGVYNEAIKRYILISRPLKSHFCKKV